MVLRIVFGQKTIRQNHRHNGVLTELLLGIAAAVVLLDNAPVQTSKAVSHASMKTLKMALEDIFDSFGMELIVGAMLRRRIPSTILNAAFDGRR